MGGWVRSNKIFDSAALKKKIYCWSCKEMWLKLRNFEKKN